MMILALFMLPVGVCGTLFSIADDVTYTGAAAFFPVSRAAVEKKLEEYNRKGVPELRLPKQQLFPDILKPGQHAVYFDFGFADEVDVDNALSDKEKETVAASEYVVSVSIPMLSGSDGGAPKYSLALITFYAAPEGRELISSSIVYPMYRVDEIDYSKDGLYMRVGKEELKIVTNRPNPCKMPASTKVEGMRALGEALELGTGRLEDQPCLRPGIGKDLPFCQALKSIKPQLQKYAGNTCETSFGESQIIESCAITVDVIKMTPLFEDFFMINSDTAKAFNAEAINLVQESMGLKYPCVE